VKRAFARLFLLAWTLVISTSPKAAETMEKLPTGVSREIAAFEGSKRVWMDAPTNTTLAWRFGKAAFDAASAATNHHDRARFATEGSSACRSALSADPKSGPAAYYLALNLGELASTRGLSALHIVREMEKFLLTARQLDPAFDHAGPDRTLGLLYHEAPGWPTSVGSNAKAREHLESAVKLDPDYPENRLSLAEIHSHGRHKDAYAEDLRALDALWPRAKTNFAGSEWSHAWADWEARRKALKKSAP
jgi:tetratricopeptide (TPR) repeat protein